MTAPTKLTQGLAVGKGLTGITELPGLPSKGTLRLPVNVADGENIVIGATTYKVVVLQTDSTQDAANGDLNNTNSNNDNVLFPTHGLEVGDLFACQSESIEVTGVPDANHVHVRRGANGTTIATHANGQALLTQSVPAGSGTVKIGLLATLTPAVFIPRFVATVNNAAVSRENVKAVSPLAGQVVVFSTDKPGGSPKSGVFALGTTETLAGSGNAWDAATLVGGRAPYLPMIIRGVPTAAEVTAALIVIVTPFATPVVHSTRWITTSSGAAALVDGAVTVSGNLILIDQAGSTDFAATHTYELIIAED